MSEQIVEAWFAGNSIVKMLEDDPEAEEKLRATLTAQQHAVAHLADTFAKATDLLMRWGAEMEKTAHDAFEAWPESKWRRGYGVGRATARMEAGKLFADVANAMRLRADKAGQ